MLMLKRRRERMSVRKQVYEYVCVCASMGLLSYDS